MKYNQQATVNPLHIAIVDPVAEDRAAIRAILQQENAYRVSEAEDTETGLALCYQPDAERPDLVLLNVASGDLLMLEAMRDMGVLLPVIALTDDIHYREAAEAMRLGAQDFIAKSDITAEILTYLIQRAVENFRQMQQHDLEILTVRQQQTETSGLLEAMLTNAPIGFAFFDRAHRFVRINDVMAKFNGAMIADHLGRTDREMLFPSEASEVVYNRIEQVFTTGQALENQEISGKMFANAGVVGYWLASYFPIVIDNEVRFVGVTVIEITERKQAAEALRLLNESLEQRVADRTAELQQINEELDQFAYVASHDLKAPLRAIGHLANWIVEDAADVLPAASKTHLDKMQGRIERMERLLDDLLAYSRAGRYYKTAEQVDTGDLIQEVIELLAPPPTFTITIPDEMPTLTTYRVPLELVFRNLIGNALKHHHKEDGHITISVDETGDDVSFTIADDGPGIDPAFHERIFQLFQTLKPRDDVEGSGMGLAVVKKIIDKQGGTITVDSAKGSGAIFRFTWPTENLS